MLVGQPISSLFLQAGPTLPVPATQSPAAVGHPRRCSAAGGLPPGQRPQRRKQRQLVGLDHQQVVRLLLLHQETGAGSGGVQGIRGGLGRGQQGMAGAVAAVVRMDMRGGPRPGPGRWCRAAATRGQRRRPCRPARRRTAAGSAPRRRWRSPRRRPAEWRADGARRAVARRRRRHLAPTQVSLRYRFQGISGGDASLQTPWESRTPLPLMGTTAPTDGHEKCPLKPRFRRSEGIPKWSLGESNPTPHLTEDIEAPYARRRGVASYAAAPRSSSGRRRTPSSR